MNPAPVLSHVGRKKEAMRILFFLFLLFLLCSCSEQLHRRYETTSSAIAAGEKERGWLPRWIPASATDIHIQGDQDTNQVWVRLNLPEAELKGLKNQMERLPEVEVEKARWVWPRNSADWWFEGLIQHQPSNNSALHADIFTGKPPAFEKTTYVAFDRVSNRVYAWWQ